MQTLGQLIQRLGEHMRATLRRGFEYAEHQIVALGTFGFFGFPLFYIIWRYIFPQPYESLSLRLIGSALCLPLMLKAYWPKRWVKYMPAYWYATTLYALPFFFAVMLFKNTWSVNAVMAMLIAIFLLILMVDVITLIVMMTVGVGCAWLFYVFTTPHIVLRSEHVQYIIIYLFAIVTGGLFNYKTSVLKREKLEALAVVSGSIAHELRTPLLGIKSGSSGVKRFLPALFEAYQLAKAHDLPVTKIRMAQYHSLLPALERIEVETNNANVIIDMLLMNVGKQSIDRSDFAVLSMNECVEEALARYPFMDEQRELVTWHPGQDFYFTGSRVLMVHVLFNLLKNALHFIAKARKGGIRIWLDYSDRGFSLYFKDTGKGIAPDILPRVFERFYSSTTVGTGIGLSFCRLVIENFGGRMRCDSQYGEYTEFVMEFPLSVPALVEKTVA